MKETKKPLPRVITIPREESSKIQTEPLLNKKKTAALEAKKRRRDEQPQPEKKKLLPSSARALKAKAGSGNIPPVKTVEEVFKVSVQTEERSTFEQVQYAQRYLKQERTCSKAESSW